MSMTMVHTPSDLSAPSDVTLEQLVERARTLALRGERQILGITGAPGAGKSSLASRVVAELGPDLAVLVPMDGFHYANEVLHKLGRHPRKGAHDTFDAWGYVALMHRIHEQPQAVAAGREGTIYAPYFRRDLEEPIGSAVAVLPGVPLVVTEGNYLLLDRQPWPMALGLVDESWFLAPTETQRLDQLIARHERFGRTPVEARERSMGSDQRNAEFINSTAAAADLIIRLTERL